MRCNWYLSGKTFKNYINPKSFRVQTKVFQIVTKGGFKSEKVKEFSTLPKNIPKNYLKFVYPVHDIDKTTIINIFDFTSLTYLQVLQKGFQDHYQKSYIAKAFYTCTNKQQ